MLRGSTALEERRAGHVRASRRCGAWWWGSKCCSRMDEGLQKLEDVDLIQSAFRQRKVVTRLIRLT